MQDTLAEAERWLLEYFIQPGTDVPSVVLKDFEKLDTAVQESYFRDLAQRSGMLLFVTREEVRLVQERRRRPRPPSGCCGNPWWTAGGSAGGGPRPPSSGPPWARRSRASPAPMAAGISSDYLDQRYLITPPRQSRPLCCEAWSKVLQSASYASAGIGAVGITIALPALAGMRSR